MAAIRAPSSAFLSAFLPVARAQLFPAAIAPITTRIPLLQRLRSAPALALTSLLPAVLVPIPSLLSEAWEGVLKAVPKKKTSHMKKRIRQLAPEKRLRDVTALNTCSACGRAKRAHVLCPYCVQSIRRWFGTSFRPKHEVEAEERRRWEEINEERRVKGKKPLDLPKRLEKKDGEKDG